MNRFNIFPCISQKENSNGYSGALASLASITNPNVILFFPISEENASIVNFSLKEENRKKMTVHQDVVGVYKTMIESWKTGDRYISGIILDAKYDLEIKEDIIEASITLIDSEGNLDSLIKTNFVQALIIGAIENMEIYITDELFNKLQPPIEKSEEDYSDEDINGDGDDINNNPKMSPDLNSLNDKTFPIDYKIISIAKKIMDGKIEEK